MLVAGALAAWLLVLSRAPSAGGAAIEVPCDTGDPTSGCAYASAAAQTPRDGTYLTLSGPRVVLPKNLPQAAIARDQKPLRIIPLRAPNSRPDQTYRAPEANAVDSAAAAPELQTAAADILSSFDGLDSTDNPVPGTPPDPQLAVGPGHIVEFVNNVGRISNKSGAALSTTFTLASFFGVPAGNDDFDPKIIYDDIHDRFFASYISLSPGGDGFLHLATSQTSDPTGAWNVYFVGPHVGATVDYAGIGVADDKFTISYNLFLSADDTFLGAETLVVEKADVMAGAAATAFAFAADHSRFTVRPAHNLSPGADQYLTTFSAPFGCCVNINRITVIRITGRPGAGNVIEASATPLSIIPQMSPFDAPTAGPGIIKSGDQRMLEAIWRGGRLWSSAGARCRPATDTADRACLHLIEVDTVGTPSVVQDIMYGAPGEYFTFPAIRTDASGNLYVSFTGTHGGVFASAKVAGRLATDPPGTMSGACLLKAGEIVHNSGRWGDYMGAAVDPADPSKVWVVGQYAKADGLVRWGTFIGSLSFGVAGLCPAQPAPPPPISYVVDTTSNSGALTACDPLTPDDCGLRGAVTKANASAPADIISFSIPASDPGFDGTLYTIDVGDSPLELTSHGTEIDATTQPGFSGSPVVRLRARNAAVAPVDRAAIGIFSSGNSVRGLLINASPGTSLTWGIYVGGGGGNQIAGNWFGLNATGSAPEVGTSYSIGLIGAGPGNLIGGTGAGDGNVICNGVLAVAGGENLVQGNIIGPDKTGTVDLLCTSGIQLAVTRWNLIGGTTPAARNVISGNATGVYLGSAATDNVLQGNYIGVDATGNVALPNFLDGVVITPSISSNGQVIAPGASFNLIGGPEPGAGNVISASSTSAVDIIRANVKVAGDDNTVQGNLIGPNADCAIPTGPATYADGLILGGDRNRVLGNVISGNPGTGVEVRASEANVLQGNIIGMGCSGAVTLGNGQWGVRLLGGLPLTGTMIGGAGPGEGNVIAGNGLDDVTLSGGGVAGNVFKGNVINLDANGSAVISDLRRRIDLFLGAHDNIFGGKGPGDGNLIGCMGAFEPVTVDGAGTVGNSFLGNTYRCTAFGPGFFGGYPIDLVSGGNTELAAPILTNDHPPRGTTCPGCQVEIVSHRGTSGLAVNSVVEGWTIADPAGNFELAAAPVGCRIFAAATDAAGNTSEFSAGLLVDFDNDGVPDCTDADDDNDGFTDVAEAGSPLCGNGVNDDNLDDAVIDDGCPGGPPQAGSFSEAQFKIGTNPLGRCGVGAEPGPSTAWPADFVSGGIPNSTDKITLTDLTSFLAPVRRMGTSPGDANFSPRWDLVPGRGVFGTIINVNDITNLVILKPPMPPFNGSTRAFGGPACTDP